MVLLLCQFSARAGQKKRDRVALLLFDNNRVALCVARVPGVPWTAEESAGRLPARCCYREVMSRRGRRTPDGDPGCDETRQDESSQRPHDVPPSSLPNE